MKKNNKRAALPQPSFRAQFENSLQVLISGFKQRTRTTGFAKACLLVVSIAALIPSAAVALGKAEHAIGMPRIATDGELQQIVAVIFADLKLQGIPPPPPAPGEQPRKAPSYPVVLVNETTAFCGESKPGKDACPEHGEFGSDLILSSKSGSEISTQLVSALYAANRVARSFVCVASEWVHCTTPAAIATIFSGKGWWENFYQTFPRTSGYSKISNIVISQDGHQALLYLSYSCDGLCGDGRFLLLERVGSTWVIKQQIHTWVS